MTNQRLRLTIIVLLCGIITNLSSQTDTTSIANANQDLKYQAKKDNHPSCVIKINSSFIKADTTIIKKIDPSWIRKIVVLKDEKYKNLYDSPPGESTIVFYIKKRFSQQVKQIIKE
jgi:hypothetical protein